MQIIQTTELPLYLLHFYLLAYILNYRMDRMDRVDWVGTDNHQEYAAENRCGICHDAFYPPSRNEHVREESYFRAGKELE